MALQEELNHKVNLELCSCHYVIKSYHRYFPHPPCVLLNSNKHSLKYIVDIIPKEDDIVNPDF